MSGAMGLDLGFSDHDEPLSELAERVPGVRSIVEGVIESAPEGTRATVGDLARVNARSTRVTDTPEQIADEIEQLREKLFPDGGPQLPARHPARSYRALFERGRAAVTVGS